jgi:hypothetical protein
VGGNVTDDGRDALRPRFSRPHWWVVLAVSLSLLALVAAATGDHGRVPARRGAAPAVPSGGRDGVPSRRGPPAGTTTTTTTTTAPPVTTPTSAPADDADSFRAVTSASTTASSTTTTTTTTAPPSSTTTTTQAAPVTAQTENFSGSLQQPDLSTASYSFSGAGSMRVSASWTPAPTTLSVTVTCPAGTLTEEGTSTLSVALPDADGACETTIKETVVDYAAVSYTLTIGPTPGG